MAFGFSIGSTFAITPPKVLKQQENQIQENKEFPRRVLKVTNVNSF